MEVRSDRRAEHCMGKGYLCALPIRTRYGVFHALYSVRGLVRLVFPGYSVGEDCGHRLQPELRRWHHLTSRAVRLILRGEKPNQLPPMDLSAGSNFQRCVWSCLLGIPRGKTVTYGELALVLMGDRRFARAVAQACKANPIPLIIPCHRVIRSDGSLGGYAPGIEWKRLLLEIEMGKSLVNVPGGGRSRIGPGKYF